jgi:hypothetical protein
MVAHQDVIDGAAASTYRGKRLAKPLRRNEAGDDFQELVSLPSPAPQTAQGRTTVQRHPSGKRVRIAG